jgi:dTDP-4-amino-4,6-dideoxygalactose transaminase
MSVPPKSVAVPALDLRSQYETIRGEIEFAVRRVLESQRFVMGPEVEQLEAELAEYCQVPHAIACASGTDALLLPLMAWRVGPGDEVITTPYTFFATAGSIWRAGAKPVFVDIEPDTFNLDPKQVEAAISPRTRVIIPVHLYGQMADMDPILDLAKRRELFVLEDAAQAIGAIYKARRAGSLGDAAAFSFYPSKNLGAYGDGGLMTTREPTLASALAQLRVHGMEPKYYHHEVGLNSRLDALQAAVLRVKLRHVDTWTHARREAAERYRSLFKSERIDELVTLPVERPANHHVFNQYVISVPASLRDPLRTHLTARQIGTEIYYPIPLHLQPCFAPLGHKPGDFPVAERAARSTIALPLYPELTEEQQTFVVGSIRQFLDAQTRDKAA